MMRVRPRAVGEEFASGIARTCIQSDVFLPKFTAMCVCRMSGWIRSMGATEGQGQCRFRAPNDHSHAPPSCAPVFAGMLLLV